MMRIQPTVESTPLDFVFSRTGRRLLTADEERAQSETMWASRRRLERLLRGGTSRDLPRHREPLSRETVARLLAAEAEARRLRPIPELIARELRNIDAAKDTLVRRNLRLVAWVAKRFLGQGLELADLFQEGTISLLEAVNRYDPAHGTRLTTYAARAIQLGIARALAEKGRMVRVPVHRMKEVRAAVSTRKGLAKTLEREPTEDEVSDRSGIPAERLAEIAPALRPVQSLDAPVPGTELSFTDVLADENPSPMDRAATSEAKDLARKALAALSARERKILKLRFGIGVPDAHSLESIGRVIGLSRERSRQIEQGALHRARAVLLRAS